MRRRRARGSQRSWARRRWRSFRCGVDEARSRREIRHQGRSRVRLLGLGRRALFDLVVHRARAGDRHRTRQFSRIPARRPRRRRAFRADAAAGQYPRADGASWRLVSQHLGLCGARRHSLRPAARALSRLSPAARHGVERQVRHARRRAGRDGDGAGHLGRAGHQRPARVLPDAASGNERRADRFPRRGGADRRRCASS